MTNPTPHGQVPASSAVLKAIREANMQLVRTGDDAFMLVPYKVATAQVAALRTEQPAPATQQAGAPVAEDVEDAARYQWIRGPVEESTRYSRWRIEYWDGPNGWQPMQRERMDAAIDAARAQAAQPEGGAK